ncbi:MAG TPA: hypothetical protein VND64_07835 [Pirellulales bacterium]|nr:hypothetical protein [Pirellulales bacterium]
MSPPHAFDVAAHVGQVHVAQAAMARELLRTARHVLVVRRQLDDDQAWEQWAAEHFEFGPGAAQTLSAIAETFAAEIGEAIDLFQPGALYVLAQPGAGGAAAEAMHLARRKRVRITCELARRLVDGTSTLDSGKSKA